MNKHFKIENWSDEFNRLISQVPIEGNHYYQVSRFADQEDKIKYAVYSHWAGWADQDERHEIREPSFIKPELAIQQFNGRNEPLLVINNENDLIVYISFLGGHSIIAEHLADTYLSNILKPVTTLYTYDKGHLKVTDIPEQMFNRAANAKLRMQILNRDNRRCKICGASPKNNEHVELHLHHIIPYADGGLTNENNLITLCHTCHKGLEPHTDYSLFNHIDVNMLSGVKSTEDYITRIKRNVEVGLKRLKAHQNKRKS